MKICLDPLFNKTKNGEGQYCENSCFHVNNYNDNESMWEFLLHIGYTKSRQIKENRNKFSSFNRKKSTVVGCETNEIVPDISLNL